MPCVVMTYIGILCIVISCVVMPVVVIPCDFIPRVVVPYDVMPCVFKPCDVMLFLLVNDLRFSFTLCHLSLLSLALCCPAIN